ncbi:MAG: hypothetical protein K0S47_2852 [Herbinix sp.]|jgi:hypothetical protein|nr:hypothetical protein [Herbinix sp.]
MKKNVFIYVVMLIAGISCIGAMFLLHGDSSKPIEGSLLGIGISFIGLSTTNLIKKYTEYKNPSLKKQVQIDYNDERNTIIRNRAKAKAGDITQWLIMGIAYITILISAPLWVTLVVVIVYLIYNITGLYLIDKYQKEM